MVDGDRIRLDLKLNSENFLSSLLFFSFSKVNVRILVFHESLSLSIFSIIRLFRVQEEKESLKKLANPCFATSIICKRTTRDIR